MWYCLFPLSSAYMKFYLFIFFFAVVLTSQISPGKLKPWHRLDLRACKTLTLFSLGGGAHCARADFNKL